MYFFKWEREEKGTGGTGAFNEQQTYSTARERGVTHGTEDIELTVLYLVVWPNPLTLTRGQWRKHRDR